MVPVYLSVFGTPRSKLADKRFLDRLRRSGLDRSRENYEEAGNAEKKKKSKESRWSFSYDKYGLAYVLEQQHPCCIYLSYVGSG